MQVPGKLLPFTINFSAQTSSPRTQEMLELRLDKKRKGDARALAHTQTHACWHSCASTRRERVMRTRAHSHTHKLTHGKRGGRKGRWRSKAWWLGAGVVGAPVNKKLICFVDDVNVRITTSPQSTHTH